jgi:hypothetical protein
VTPRAVEEEERDAEVEIEEEAVEDSSSAAIWRGWQGGRGVRGGDKVESILKFLVDRGEV